VSDTGAFTGVNRFGIEYFSGGTGWPFLARTLVNWIGLGGRDPANLWAVSGNGDVIVYDGNRWSGRNFPFPSGGRIYTAFGSSSSDIWASGSRDGTTDFVLRHFDGKGWMDVDSPLDNGFVAGFARAPNDAILVDQYRRAWHWNGSSWSQITLPIFENDQVVEFWGTAPNDVWAVGGDWGVGEGTGAIYHWDGDSWQRVYRTPAGLGIIQHVAGTARDDVWFSLNTSGIVLHWDGTSVVQRQILGRTVFAIAAGGPNDVWFKNGYPHNSLTHYDGENWTIEQVSQRPDSLWGVPGAGVFFVGSLGHIYQHR
jgi:hypothetical protein